MPEILASASRAVGLSAYLPVVEEHVLHIDTRPARDFHASASTELNC